MDLALNETTLALKQKTALRFKCNALPNLDRKSKTDAMCVLWQKDSKGKRVKLGTTEMIADNLNPEFVNEIVVDYFFEM